MDVVARQFSIVDNWAAAFLCLSVLLALAAAYLGFRAYLSSQRSDAFPRLTFWVSTAVAGFALLVAILAALAPWLIPGSAAPLVEVDVPVNADSLMTFSATAPSVIRDDESVVVRATATVDNPRGKDCIWAERRYVANLLAPTFDASPASESLAKFEAPTCTVTYMWIASPKRYGAGDVIATISDSSNGFQAATTALNLTIAHVPSAEADWTLAITIGLALITLGFNIPTLILSRKTKKPGTAARPAVLNSSK